MKEQLNAYYKALTIEEDRVSRTRHLSCANVRVMSFSVENQLDYLDLDIPSFLNINQYFSHFYGETKHNLFSTFIIDELTIEIKDFEDNVYHLESVIFKMINLGIVSKLTTEYAQRNKSFNPELLHKIITAATKLFRDTIVSGDNGGVWNVFESNQYPKHYRFYIDPEEKEFYSLIEDKKDYREIANKIINVSLEEASTGAADFILVNNGLLAWMDKKFIF